ncbi:MAG TPA: uracil-DNA glycosylase [bacterium]
MNRVEFLDHAEKFLIQQAELYGAEFYSETTVAAKTNTTNYPTLAQFHDAIKDCQKCRLARGRTNFVFGVGNPSAKLLCIGEAPGYEEDKRGEPFVGEAGQLLNRMLAAIEFSRDEVYIGNIIKCRPPNNRDPEADEIAECLPYLKQQIAMINPKLILALGRIAAQSLLGSTESLSRLRKQVHRVGEIQMVVTYHPAALLRNQHWKREAWQDMKMLRRLYDQEVGDKPVVDLDKRS